MATQKKTVDVKHVPLVNDRLKMAASRILARFSDELSPHVRDRLAQYTSTDGAMQSGLYVELGLGRYTINLDITYDNFRGGEVVVDKNTGDEYAVFSEAYVSINWPFFGNMEPGLAATVASFYAAVAQFAKELDVMLAGRTAMLILTKAELDAAADKRAEQAKQQLIRGVVRNNRSKMRVDQEREIAGDVVKDIPIGTYRVEFVEEGDKVYALSVTDTGAQLKRIA